MADIVERLRNSCSCNFPDTPCGAEDECRAAFDAADEIERLRAGGCARDQGTTQYCAEAAKLAAENERLRAALEDIAYGNPLHNEDDLMRIARAALEEGRT